MTEDSKKFLTLTFDGGRFASHTVPIDVLAELGTVQQLVTRLARYFYFERHPERHRVPRGFPEATRLYLAASEPNCFSAVLERPYPWAWEGPASELSVFDEARELVIRALGDAQAGRTLPEGLPEQVVDSLTALGQRLNSDESLLIRSPSGDAQVRIDQRSRRMLARITKRPLELEEGIEGEVEVMNDAARRFLLRLPSGEHVEIPFEIEHRARVLEAMQQRPLAKLRAQGTLLTVGKMRMRTVEEIEIVDDERAPEIQKLWTRIDSFVQISDGWFDGEGLAPTERCRLRARAILARLLVDGRQLPKPAVFPNPSGGVQAEWVLGRWAAEVAFDPDEDVVIAEAIHADSGEERAEFFSSGQVTGDSTLPLMSWLEALR
ncbi:MAG TPA: hypothetical protein VH165_33685 [Kofleriaceae bacterium]|nr:hypothetical protein [Kofleriaceae bacterium]